MSKNKNMTIKAASRIYSSTSKALGTIPKKSFASRAMSTATKFPNIKNTK